MKPIDKFRLVTFESIIDRVYILKNVGQNIKMKNCCSRYLAAKASLCWSIQLLYYSIDDTQFCLEFWGRSRFIVNFCL